MHIILVFIQFAKRSEQQKFTCSIFLQAKDTTQTCIYGFFDTAQVTKLIWFNFQKKLRLEGLNFQDYSQEFEFLQSVCRILRKFTFSLLQEYHFKDNLVRFNQF